MPQARSPVTAGSTRTSTDTDAGYALAQSGVAFEKAAWVSDPATATWTPLCTTGAGGSCTSASVSNARYLVREAPAGAPFGWRSFQQLAWAAPPPARVPTARTGRRHREQRQPGGASVDGLVAHRAQRLVRCVHDREDQSFAAESVRARRPAPPGPLRLDHAAGNDVHDGRPAVRHLPERDADPPQDLQLRRHRERQPEHVPRPRRTRRRHGRQQQDHGDLRSYGRLHQLGRGHGARCRGRRRRRRVHHRRQPDLARPRHRCRSHRRDRRPARPHLRHGVCQHRQDPGQVRRHRRRARPSSRSASGPA